MIKHMAFYPVVYLLMALISLYSASAAANMDAILERLQALEDNQRRLEQQVADRDARIVELESRLNVSELATEQLLTESVSPAPRDSTVAAAPVSRGKLNPGGGGFQLIDSPQGTLNFGAWTYVRYLNQRALDEEYTDSFGREFDIDVRNDFQVNKVNLSFNGWVYDPNFRYLLYTWTSNTSQGDSAQVVVAGNLKYKFNDSLDTGVGIEALPGTRSMTGTFPHWIKVDSRTMADDYFRPSYTTGIFASGQLTDTLHYKTMLGNNLSQLGVNANKLDDGLNTISSRIDWMPTTGEYGPLRGFDDFDEHADLATLFGLAYTFSEEDRQSQPGTEDINNSQIRLSDGTRIFDLGAFDTDGFIKRANYHMVATDAGMKYRGFSLMGEYYWRWVDEFDAEGDIPEDDLFDHGFQIQTSYMFKPKTLQGYLAGSKIFGEYGNPWDAAMGVNWFPFGHRLVRVNGEMLYMNDSPIGYSSIPYAIGGDGVVVHTNLEMKF